MKKFKTVFVSFVIIVLMFSFLITLISCKKKDGKQTLTVWTALEQKELETLKEITRDFAKKEDINVVVTQIPMADFVLKYQVATPAGFGPDVITAPHDIIGCLSLAGILSPLSEKEFPASLRKKFAPVSVNSVTFDNKIYGMPFSMESIAIIYNKDLVPYVPETMEDMVNMAKNLTKDDQYGFLYQMDDTGNFYFCWPIFSGLGAYIFNNDNGKLDINDIGLDKKGAVKAIDYLKYLRQSGIMPMSVRTDTSREFFNKGKAAFIINGPWALSEVRKNNINYGVMPFPKFKNGKQPGPFVGVWALMLNPEANNRKLALKFMKYFNQPDNQLRIFNASGRIPTRVELNEEVSKNKDAKGFMESAKAGTPIPNHPAMNPVWDHMSRTIIIVIDGKEPADKALDYAVKVIKEDINCMIE
ncbi:MAG: maltose ABC transporter substrate-binding protein [Armatimonadota bacterium]